MRRCVTVAIAARAMPWLNVPMPESVGGLPLHPLVVHAVVVLLPLAAVGVAAVSLVPAWRVRFGSLVVLVAALATVAVPVATSTGEALQATLPSNELIVRHAGLGNRVLFGAVPLLAVAVALWWLGRREQADQQIPRWLRVGLSILGVAIAIAVMVQVVLVGHSGADAVWGTRT